MKTYLLMFAVIAALLLTTACNGRVRTPKTKLDVKTEQWAVKLEGEKDASIDGLTVDIKTDGTVSVTLTNFVATNSPAVIRETGKAQAATIDAQGNVFDKAGNLVGKVVEGVVTYFGQ